MQMLRFALDRPVQGFAQHDSAIFSHVVSPGRDDPHPVPRLRDTPLPPERESGGGEGGLAYPSADGSYKLFGPFRAGCHLTPSHPWVSPTATHGPPLRGGKPGGADISHCENLTHLH